MNDEQYLLANAYLDGELTAVERTIAEADPDVMSEVERLRAVQADIRAVEPPSEVAREAAITAAMSEFTAAGGTATAVRPAERPAGQPVPFRPRPRYVRYLSFAAAVVVVGLLGVVVVNGIGGGDADDAADIAVSDAADAAAEEPAAGALTESFETDDGDADDVATDADAGDDMAATEMADADADEMAGDTAEAELAMDEAADAGAAASDDAAPAADDEPRAGVPIVTSATVPPMTDQLTDQLIVVATDLLDRLAAGEAITGVETICRFPDQENQAMPLSRQRFETDDGAIELIVYVDEVNRLAYGVDDSTSDRGVCGLVIETAVP